MLTASLETQPPHTVGIDLQQGTHTTSSMSQAQWQGLQGGGFEGNKEICKHILQRSRSKHAQGLQPVRQQV